MSKLEMQPKSTNLIWIDLEMTGLDPNKERIIEIATVVTDCQLNVLEEGPVLAISQPASLLEAMDEWNTKYHTRSGLLKRVKESVVTEVDAQAQTIEFLMRHVPPGRSPMCGNTICQDRRFLYNYMPKLANYFHYRNLDVTTLKILASHWAPSILTGVKKEAKHLALSDIYDAINELRYYREHFIKGSN